MYFLIFYLEMNSFPQISEFVEWKNMILNGFTLHFHIITEIR